MTGLLWVAPEAVDLATGGGGGIRQVHLLRRLARHLPVRLVAAGPHLDPEVADLVLDAVLVAPRPRTATRRLVGAARGLAGTSLPEVDAAAALRAAVPGRWLADAGTVVLNHLSTQGLAAAARGRVVAHLFHSSATHLADEAGRASGTRARRWARYAEVARRLEAHAVRRADLVVCVGEADRVLLDPAGAARVEVVPNGVDVAALAMGPPAGRRVLLPGTLFWGPNVDGARWYVDEVWPEVRRRVPDASLVVAGRGPVPAVRALATRPGVEVRADVPDMAAELRRARVVVVPLRYGTGTRVKALEALAAGRSLVGTTVGLAGLGLEDGVHARLADDPAGLAAATAAALTAEDAALHRRGRALVGAHHDWSTAADRLLGLLAPLRPEPGARRSPRPGASRPSRRSSR